MTRHAEVIHEAEDDLRIGPGPRKDRLLVIADREDVPMPLRQPPDHGVLQRIEVLELVDQEVVPLPRHLAAHFGVVGE